MHIRAICIFYKCCGYNVPQNIAKQRDVRRWLNLNYVFRIALIGMGDFKRCTANPPFCLGMTDFPAVTLMILLLKQVFL